jgi:hypothetical protein
MRKVPIVLISLVAVIGLTADGAAGADLEGAVQYPPPSIAKDAQPPPPAGMMRQPVSPRRIELRASGSSTAPSIQRFYLVPSRRLGEPAEPGLQSGSGGG